MGFEIQPTIELLKHCTGNHYYVGPFKWCSIKSDFSLEQQHLLELIFNSWTQLMNACQYLRGLSWDDKIYLSWCALACFLNGNLVFSLLILPQWATIRIFHAFPPPTPTPTLPTPPIRVRLLFWPYFCAKPISILFLFSLVYLMALFTFKSSKDYTLLIAY